MIKCYYARSISIYGTEQDKRDILTLQKMGFDVVDPNQPEYQERYKTEGMDLFIRLIRECHCLSFRSHPDMYIPAGVAKEIEYAESLFLPVFELPTILSFRVLSVDDTRKYLHLIGNR